jgi:hypothetical protein
MHESETVTRPGAGVEATTGPLDGLPDDRVGTADEVLVDPTPRAATASALLGPADRPSEGVVIGSGLFWIRAGRAPATRTRHCRRPAA